MKITSKTTVREFLDDLNERGKKVKPNLKGDIIDYLYSAVSLDYPIFSSHGGARYGLWFRLTNRLSISLKPKLAQTSKTKKISATKRGFIWEFVEFKLEDSKKYLDKTLFEMAIDLDQTSSEEFFKIWDNNAKEISIENEIFMFSIAFKAWFPSLRMKIKKETKISEIYDHLVDINYMSKENGWWQTLVGMSDFYETLIGGKSYDSGWYLYSLIYKYEKLGDLTVEDLAKQVVTAKEKIKNKTLKSVK